MRLWDLDGTGLELERADVPQCPVFPRFRRIFSGCCLRRAWRAGSLDSVLKEYMCHLYTCAKGEGFVRVFEKSVGIFEIFSWEGMQSVAVFGNRASACLRVKKACGLPL